MPGIRKREDKVEDLEDRFLAPNYAITDDDSQDADQLIPTIIVKESFSSPPKRTFVRTAVDPQHDIAVLHVAFVLRNSPDLQDLIVAIEKLIRKPSVR